MTTVKTQQQLNPLGELQKSLTGLEGSPAALAFYSVIRNYYRRWSGQHVIKWAQRSYLELRNFRNAKPLHFLGSDTGIKEWAATVHVDQAVCPHSYRSLKDHAPGVRLVHVDGPSLHLFFLPGSLFSPSPHGIPSALALFLSSLLIFTVLLLRLRIAGDLSNGIFMKLLVHSALGQMLKVGRVVREPVCSELCKIHCRPFETSTSCFNAGSWHSRSMSARMESKVCGLYSFHSFPLSSTAPIDPCISLKGERKAANISRFRNFHIQTRISRKSFACLFFQSLYLMGTEGWHQLDPHH